MADSEAFDFEALDEESELSAGIISQDDGQLSELARFVTVLSDFGETEQFVIEGDSLIFLAFEDERLDWKHGGQFLHFFFIIEKILSHLLRRGAHFSVVFFESSKSIWTGSRLLARSLLISHLKAVLKFPAAIQCFPTAYSEEWAEFLLQYRPLFIGVAFRERDCIITHFARSCHSSGISIMYLSQMEILDHSVRGFYVPTRCIFNGEAFRAISVQTSAPSLRKPQSISKLSNEFLHATAKSWRSMACCHACASWLSFIQKEESIEKLAAETISKIFLIQAVLMRRNVFSIYERSLVKFVLPHPILELIQSFNEFISEFIAANFLDPSVHEDNISSPQGAELIDFYDGRLQCALADRILRFELASAEDLCIDADCRSEMEIMWSACAGASEFACLAMFPLKFDSHLCSASRELKDADSDNSIKTQIFSCDVILPDCSFAKSIVGLAECEASVKNSTDPPVIDENLLDGMGWKCTEALESFLWTHCKDQSASSDNSRSTSEWERKRQIRWKARQSQMYFRHLHDYAASLAGTTVLGSTCISAGDVQDEPQADDDAASTVSEQSVDSKKGKNKPDKKKPEKKLSKKEQLLADIEAKKLKGASQKLEVEWKDLKAAIKKSGSSVAKLKDLDDFIVRCMAASQIALALEVMLEKLEESKLAWQDDRDSKNDNMKFAILTVETVRSILVNFSELLRDPSSEIGTEARNDILQTMVSLGFIEPALQLSRSFLDPTDADSYSKLQDETKEIARLFRNKLSIPSKSLAHFQLEHMGYLLPRPPPKVKDPRITTFTPDEWQRTLLDVVDSRDSALVCAPTSSGKTFISYYCMEKVMRDSTCKDGVLVFVAPTKALINQIAAQVYGAYHSHFGIYTDAYRHRALTCRILVTVPDCLESLLLSPEHSVWAQRIRYIILDEVHCISSSDGGKLWEHILLLSNAPFLALSATVGEPEAFVAWLQRLKDFQGGDSGNRDESYKVRLVQHSERWVDLRRHVYLGKKVRGSEDASALVKAGRLYVRAKVDHTSAEIDMAEVLETLHPLASFTSTQLEMGSASVNVRFEPRDSLALFNALWSVCRQAKEGSPVKQRSDALTALDPVTYFGEIIFISKPQSVLYEAAIKKEFENWIVNGWRKECVQVLRLLGNDLVENDSVGGENREKLDKENEAQKDEMVNRLFHLMCALHRQDRLPAVVFNFDRTLCESIAFGFNAILGRAEDAARAEHSKTLAKSAKVESQKDKVQKRIRDKVLSEKKEEAMLQEMAEMAESTTVESAGIDEVSFKAQFTFVQEGRSSKQDFERITESARKIMGEGHPLIQILRRGIGVHHSGLQNKYRMAVEMLFRCGFLRIVIATETLAFGINMPCRSVVFAGDNVALNSIQYQQMSGRAGRRGLDVLGHVIFFDVPRHKMHRLMVAPVPKLRGHFLHSSTFLLRLLALDNLVSSQRGATPLVVSRVRNAVSRALSQSLFDAEFSNARLVRSVQGKYILDSLVRRGLVDGDGFPKGLMSLANHLHSTEPSNLALVALLQGGALHQICRKPDGEGWDVSKQPAVWRGSLNDWDAVARDLLVVLSHLFCRERLHSSLTQDATSAARRGLVLLPQLPESCIQVLHAFHRSTLLSLSSAAAALAADVPPPAQLTLPLSKLNFPSKQPDVNRQGACGVALSAGSIDVCNAFACLSGDCDTVASCQDLVSSAREELGLHDALVPLPTLPGPPLSAYVVDFFSHEQLDLVCRECGMCSAVAWQGLRQFQLILSSLHKALDKYAPPSDILLASIARLDTEYSGKFYAKLYR